MAIVSKGKESSAVNVAAIGEALDNAIEALESLKAIVNPPPNTVEMRIEAMEELLTGFEEVNNLFEDNAVPKEDIQEEVSKLARKLEVLAGLD